VIRLTGTIVAVIIYSAVSSYSDYYQLTHSTTYLQIVHICVHLLTF
jgi:hypothetical protein